MKCFSCVRGALLAAACLLATSRLHAQSYAFTTIAGSSGVGYVDGPGIIARFGILQDVKVDASGNLYVSDYGNFVIRKITPDGIVSTLAGLSAVGGSSDGTGSGARFGFTFGLGIDRAGNVLVADAANQTIRRVTPAGVVTTIAGAVGVRGAADGPVAVARFNAPEGITVDAAGNIYIADFGNHTIRKITTAGIVSTLAGSPGVAGTLDGVGDAARFSSPSDVAVDAAGVVYVADSGNNTIRRVAPDGTVTTLAGSAGNIGTTNGTGSAARFNVPLRLVVDSGGNLLVADRGNDAIRRVTPAGVVTTFAGVLNSRGSIDGPAAVARFFRPSGLGVDAAGNVFVADTYNATVRKITAAGTVTTVAGAAGMGGNDGLRSAASFFQPRGLALDSNGTLYVADQYNQVIRTITPDGTVATLAGQTGIRGSADGVGSEARFLFPQAVAVDDAGNVFASDNNNHTVRKITSGRVVGTLAGAAGQAGSVDGTLGAARLNFPAGLAVDAAGNVFVADSGNHTIRKITPEGAVTTLAGQAGAAGGLDGTGSAARFNFPYGLAIDRTGVLYVAEAAGNTIRKVTPAGVVTTFAGQAGVAGALDGTGAAARFAGPEALAVDAAGNVYVTDTGNQLIRMITPAGVVTTIGGSSAGLGNWEGIGSLTRFFFPSGIAADAAGNIWIGDYYNNTIRKGGLVGVANPTSALVNVSVRAALNANQRLIVGFNMSGEAKPVLVRAVGPGLAPFLGGATVVNDPALELYTAASTLADANDNWGGTAALRTSFAGLGAFSLPDSSRDAALLRSVTGSYSTHLIPPNSGVGLIEVYDAGEPGVRTARLTNLSARYQASSGSGALIAGFVVSGSGPKTLLIRGIGPGLATFGVTDAIADPLVEVFNSAQQRIALTDNWAASLQSTFTQVGAFQVSLGSRDAALLISLVPGAYTAQLTGIAGGSGNGLIEVYEIGN